MKTLSTLFRYILLTALCMFLAYATNAQLTIKGKIYSEGPVKVSLTHQSDGNTYNCYISKQKEVTRDSTQVMRAKYNLPWGLEPNYNHAINFTDGTIDKMIYVHGPVPEGIYPRQTYEVDIDLTSVDGGETLVIFWSDIESSYIALPLADLDEINKLAYTPLRFQKHMMPQSKF